MTGTETQSNDEESESVARGPVVIYGIMTIYFVHMIVDMRDDTGKRDDTSAEMTQEALRNMHHSVQRDAAKTRKSDSFDNVADVQRDAEETEIESGEERHRNAY